MSTTISLSSKRFWLFFLSSVVTVTLNEAASETSTWQSVNVGWLANPKMFQPKMLPKMKVPDSNSGVFHLTPSKQNHCYLLIRYDLGESRFLRPRFVVREFSSLHFFLIHPQPPFPSPLEERDAGSCYLNYLIDVLPKLVIVTTYYLWAVSHLFSLLLWHSYLMQTYLEDLFISSEILLKDSSAFELSRSPLNSWY